MKRGWWQRLGTVDSRRRGDRCISCLDGAPSTSGDRIPPQLFAPRVARRGFDRGVKNSASIGRPYYKTPISVFSPIGECRDFQYGQAEVSDPSSGSGSCVNTIIAAFLMILAHY